MEQKFGNLVQKSKNLHQMSDSLTLNQLLEVITVLVFKVKYGDLHLIQLIKICNHFLFLFFKKDTILVVMMLHLDLGVYLRKNYSQ